MKKRLKTIQMDMMIQKNRICELTKTIQLSGISNLPDESEPHEHTQ